MDKFNFFKAKKTIPQQDIDVKSMKVSITPSMTEEQPEGEPIEKQGLIDFNIKDVEPIKLTDKEWKSLKTTLINIAKRAPNLKNITDT